MLRGLIKTANSTCKTGTREECAAAWDQVEEVSRMRHRKRVPYPRPKDSATLSKCGLERIGENLQEQEMRLKKQKEDLFFLWKHYNYIE